MSSPNAPAGIPPDTELLLLRLDLKTERLLAEVEPIVLHYANIQAQLAPTSPDTHSVR